MLISDNMKKDVLAALGLLLFLCAFALTIDFSIAPFEDAAILMRYAKHLAEGHGIVWNINEAPVDGATDFLFMVAVAILHKLGLSLEFAVRLLAFTAHIFTVWLVYFTLRFLWHTSVTVAFIPAAYLAIGPGLYYVAAYFGTPCFALAAGIVWWAALNIISGAKVKCATIILFCATSLITALIRPEGVILTALMLTAIVWCNGWHRTSKIVICYLAFFCY